MHRKACLVIALTALIVAPLCSTNAYAQDKWRTADIGLPADWNPPAVFVSLGFSARLDDMGRVSESPGLNASSYFYVTRGVALRAALEYVNSSSVGSSSARILGLSGGLRLEVVAPPVSPYFEFGLNTRRYSGTAWGREVEDTRAGLDFSFGLAIRLSKHSALDVTLRQVFNNVEFYVTDTAPILPPDDQSFIYHFGPPTGRFSQTVYNPATITIQYRFKL
jgi:hypothetical protein